MASSPTTQPCPQCGTTYDGGQQYCATCGFPVGSVSGPADDKFIGRSLPGGYHILDLISVGGMGRVYRAEQSVLGRTVAVKVIHPHLLSDENSALRFMTEARAASQLNHPNSIAVFDFGRTDDGQPYLVMEFLRGKDLAHVAYDEGPLPLSRIVDVLRQTLAALAEAHDLEIVHRDLKPENIVLEPLRRGGDFVKVLDFGLAKLKADAAAPSNVTSPGIVCGTPDYMAPEQGRGDAIDGRSDLYAVGVILFQLLTGRLPFEADSPTQVVMMHLTLPVPDPRDVAPDRNIPQAIVDVVTRALDKDADKRFQDAMEFSDALAAALEWARSSPPTSGMPSARPGQGSLVPGEFVNCSSCSNTVPMAKFCCECGAPLATASMPPEIVEAVTPDRLPLPLVCRDEDLQWLDDRRQRLGRALVGARVVGEPGAGKTRLLQEFLQRAENDGDVVVRARPDPYWAEVSYHALREAIRGLTCLSNEDIAASDFPGAHAEAKLGLVEIFAKRPPENDGLTPASRRHSLAEAMRWALRRVGELAAGTRVILAIDDLHRIDTPSRNAFADAVGEALNVSVLVVAAHVPGFESGWRAEHAARVLSGIPGNVVTRLMRSSRPSFSLSEVESEEGKVLPLHVDQMVRYALEVGGEPPARLGDLIAQRVDLLEPSARLALQALAVLGDRVETALLAQMLPDTHRLDVTLDLLSRSGMIVREKELVSASHPLLREVVLAGIPATARRDLHAKALTVFEKRSAPLEARAQHAYHSQDSFQALLLLEQIATRAARRADTGTEVLALRRALEIARVELSKGELDDPLQAILIFGRKLGSALTRAGDFADAEGVLREALDVAGPSGTERARVLGALAQVAQARERRAEAIEFIEEAIETARQSGAHELVGSLTAARAGWGS